MGCWFGNYGAGSSEFLVMLDLCEREKITAEEMFSYFECDLQR